MISDSILALLNNQVTMEQGASQAYLHLQNVFCRLGLQGFAKWAGCQACDELSHAKKIVDYINLCHGKLDLQPIVKPVVSETNLLQIFESILGLEHGVTLSVSNLMKNAIAQNDFATQNFLVWFVDEQVESEYFVVDMIARLALSADNPEAILFLDGEIGEESSQKFNVTLRG
jgi:ferritin